MAEIKLGQWRLNTPLFRNTVLIVTFLIAVIYLSISQVSPKQEVQKKEKKKVELIYADSYEPDEKLGQDVVRFLGHVAFKHKEIILTCDSAYFFQKANQLKAFSRVHIQQGDTLNLYGDYLFYDGSEEIANVDGNVELIDKETHLHTKSVVYDVAKKIARYTENGTITNGKNILKSRRGTYDVPQELFHFKDSIKITNPEYVMTGDTMDYSTKTETVFFAGPSEINGDSIYIYSERGWYDTKNDISTLWQNALINNRQQILKGDSLYYEKNTGFGQAFRNISISDTTNNIIVCGEYARYFKNPENFFVTNRAVFIQVSDTDSLFLHADTISARTVKADSGNPYRLMKAYYGCRVYSKDLQSKCDSLSYSFRDSVIRLYNSPVLWSESNQLTSDSMAIFTKDRRADKMELYNNAFISSWVDSLRFDQIKGRNLTGYFMANKLYRILVVGNGESVYYLEDKDKLVGVTHNKSASIDIKVDKGKIQEITEFQNPDGKLDPPLLNSPDKMKLPGFSWQALIRPGKYSDIFLKFKEEKPKSIKTKPASKGTTEI
jgi:lipopolysaccharide export system protein LptA